jgi:hypothetical protein
MCAVVLLVVTMVAAAPRSPDFSADRFKAHVTFLADDTLEGREAGTRGHEIAARYIASQFALLGVKPAGNDGTYYEKAAFLESALTGAPPTIEIEGSGKKQTFHQGEKAFIVGPLSGGTTDVRAPLVFAGYGMTDTVLGVDDYAGLDVTGKIAVVLWGLPSGMDTEIGAHLQSEQAHTAAEHGAVGVVRIAVTIPWATVEHFGGRPLTTWVNKDGTPFDRTGGLKAGAVLQRTAAEVLFDGSTTQLPQILDAAAKGTRPKGFALKTTGRLVATTATRKFSSPEVVGVIEGSDPALKHEYVALMAHADHIGITGTGPGDHINNGALDNAAGIATLLEVGRAFATSAAPPRRSILLVANTAEEKGLLGAEFFAHYPAVPIDRITAAIDLDMPLLLYDFTDVVAFGASHSTLDTAFRQAGSEIGVSLSPDPMPEESVFTRSDHYPMVKAGVPAVMLATGMANGGEKAYGTFLANNYHQPSDDLSQPIVWSAGAKFAELNYRAVRTLADANERAHWYAHDYFGEHFAPNAHKAVKPAQPTK